MKAIFKADCTRGGFIISTVATGERKHHHRFSVLNSLVLIGLLFGFAAIVRLIVIH